MVNEGGRRGGCCGRGGSAGESVRVYVLVVPAGCKCAWDDRTQRTALSFYLACFYAQARVIAYSSLSS